MKKLNQNYFTIAVYALAVFAFSLLFLLICINLGVITSAIGSFLSGITSILYGILFAFLLFPAVKRLDLFYNRLFCKRNAHPFLVSGFSIATALLIALGLVAALLIIIVPQMVVDVEKLYVFITGIKDRLDGFVAPITETRPFFHDLYVGITEFFFGTGESSSIMDSLVSSLGNIVSIVINQVSSVFMGLIIAVYLLASRRAISGIFGKLVVAFLPEKHVNRFVMFFKRLYTDFSAFAFHRFLIAFFFGAVTVLFCSLADVPLLSVIVLLVLISHLIPVVGTILGVTSSITLVVILKGPIWGVIYGAILLMLEIVVSSVVLPNMLPKKLRPPYAVTAAMVLLFLTLFGVIGAFVAVPVYATLNVEFRRFIVHRLAKKKLPISSDAYRDFNASIYKEAVNEHASLEASEEEAPKDTK